MTKSKIKKGKKAGLSPSEIMGKLLFSYKSHLFSEFMQMVANPLWEINPDNIKRSDRIKFEMENITERLSKKGFIVKQIK